MSANPVRITEFDEAGNLTATYVETQSQSQGLTRVDIIPPVNSKSPWQRVLDVFLPVGYPHSVTDDYLEYQIYDSLQAFSSSIAGLLSSRAVLSSVGVGDSTASPTAALLLTILQETAGRIATILFAHRFGTSLEPECKMYRLLADILNDMAFILDCLSPGLPKTIRMMVLSFSSVLRALCGVAAGSAKASLSAHFARWGNLGELNAKDSSQETVVSLLGMLAGSIVISWVTSPFATWTSLILLLSIHLETNRRAVRAVKMRSLNRQRATLVFYHLRRGHIPSPGLISQQERIFEQDGVLRGRNDEVLGYCAIGTPMSQLFDALSRHKTSTSALHLDRSVVPELLSIYSDMYYIEWLGHSQATEGVQIQVVLKEGVGSKDILVAWWQALIFAQEVRDKTKITEKGSHTETTLSHFARSKQAATELLRKYEHRLKEAGWDLESSALETVASTRVAIME